MIFAPLPLKERDTNSLYKFMLLRQFSPRIRLKILCCLLHYPKQHVSLLSSRVDIFVAHINVKIEKLVCLKSPVNTWDVHCCKLYSFKLQVFERHFSLFFTYHQVEKGSSRSLLLFPSANNYCSKV